jgi:hypothetical protein
MNFKNYVAYKPIDKYIVKNNKLVELRQDMLSKELFIELDNLSSYKYEEHLDGTPLSKEEAAELFPEYFI